jgi:hypothetical protein
MIALFPAVMPASCTYAWAARTEPLYGVLLVTGSLFFVRAVRTKRYTDYLFCGLLAGSTFWVRPFGLICVSAALLGLLFQSVSRRRFVGCILSTFAMGLLVGLFYFLKHGYDSGGTITHYTKDSTLVTSWLQELWHISGWQELGLAISRDISGLFVSTFGVIVPLVIMAWGWSIRHIRRLELESRVILLASTVLILGTLGLAGISRHKTTDFSRMFSRYLDTLLPLLIIIATVAWYQFKNNTRARMWGMGLVVGMTFLFALTLPKGIISFSNNPGFFYWGILNKYTGSFLSLAVLPLLWYIFSKMRRRPVLGFMVLCSAGIISTILVAHNIYQFNTSIQPMREGLNRISRVMEEKTIHDPVTVWIDPRPRLLSAKQAFCDDFVAWLLRYELPLANIRFSSSDQIITTGDFLISSLGIDSCKQLVREEGIFLYQIDAPIDDGKNKQVITRPSGANHPMSK